ncbi:hypothetical protein F5Y10DRAFT_264513 [Nemania abortiva]|nr:hypothetical protein F5Y10DRAFT_264513 [Nemania abortiva]
MSTIRIIATKVIRRFKFGTDKIKIGIVTKTDRWERTEVDTGVDDQFVEAAKKNISQFPSGIDGVYMKETPRPDRKDNRTHFTALALNRKKEVLDSLHFRI